MFDMMKCFYRPKGKPFSKFRIPEWKIDGASVGKTVYRELSLYLDLVSDKHISAKPPSTRQ